MGYKVYIRNISKQESKQKIEQAIYRFGEVYRIDVKVGPFQTWFATVQFKKKESKADIIRPKSLDLKGAQVFGDAICYKCFDEHNIIHKYGQQCTSTQATQLKQKSQKINAQKVNKQKINSPQYLKNQQQKVKKANQVKQSWIVLNLLNGIQKKISLNALGITLQQIKSINIETCQHKQRQIQSNSKINQKQYIIYQNIQQQNKYQKDKTKKIKKKNLQNDKQKYKKEQQKKQLNKQIQVQQKLRNLKINDSSIEIYSQFVKNIEVDPPIKKKLSKYDNQKVFIS